MIRKLTLPALALTAALGLAACTATPPAAPAPTSTDEALQGNDEHTLVPIPTATPDRSAVAARAVDALTAYGRRDLAYEEWFAQLRPFLEEKAVDAYATVEPSRIPSFTIDGADVADATDTYAVVDVATSIGRYTIELRRADASAEWSVTRFQPPN